jgi:hypothetical protein
MRRRTTGVSLAGAAIALLLTATACSSSTNSSFDTTTTTAASSTTARPTTTYPAPPAVPITIPVSTDGTSPDGSGCEPPPGTGLPDGLWFGVLSSIDATHNMIGLDLACWFSGKAAQTAAGSSTPVPNDYYVRNVNPTVYQLPTSPHVAVLSLAGSSGGATGEFNPTTTGVVSANAILTDASKHYVWVQITHGYVVVIQEQFTP